MIYICIPAHNEEQTVGVVLWKIRQVMAEFPRDYQLLVVDDASSDKTPDVLAPYARVLPLTVVRSDRQRGQAAAIEMMLREAVRRSEYPKRDMVVTLQADFTQEPDELVGLIKRMEAGADIVVGQPLPDPVQPRAVRWGRRLARRLAGRSTPEGVADPFMGYAAYRVFTVKKALEDAGGRLLHWGGWAGAAELLAAAAPQARRIETLDMLERRERLQRPSRLDVWPAVKAVWALVRGRLPTGLENPAELDQAMQAVAARRTSELALAPRDRTPRFDRAAETQRPTRRRGSTEERRERKPRPERPERPERPAAGERRPRKEAAAQGERNGKRRNGRPAPSPAPAPALPADEAALVTAAPPEAGAEPVRRKRPRRRKRPARPEGTAPAPEAGSLEPAAVGVESGGTEGSPAESDGAAVEGTVNGEGAARARRRRRGRRGGRRRAGGAAAGGAENPSEPGDGAPAAETPAVERHDEPIGNA